MKQAITFGCGHDGRGEQGGENIMNLNISPLSPKMKINCPPKTSQVKAKPFLSLKNPFAHQGERFFLKNENKNRRKEKLSITQLK